MKRVLLFVAICCLTACNKNKSGEATPPAEPPAAEAEAEEKHFDVSADQSGALARAAAVLEAEGIDNEDLRLLSHHAERFPTAAVVCKHIVEVRGSTGGIKDCVESTQHHIAQLGPELWAAASSCFMEATTTAQLDACVAAEEEAEKLLHDKPHGEGLDHQVCEAFFEKFVDLASEQAKKEEAAHIEQVLSTVREDIIRTCMEQGTAGEMSCAQKADTLHSLEVCAESLV